MFILALSKSRRSGGRLSATRVRRYGLHSVWWVASGTHAKGFTKIHLLPMTVCMRLASRVIDEEAKGTKDLSREVACLGGGGCWSVFRGISMAHDELAHCN